MCPESEQEEKTRAMEEQREASQQDAWNDILQALRSMEMKQVVHSRWGESSRVKVQHLEMDDEVCFSIFNELAEKQED